MTFANESLGNVTVAKRQQLFDPILSMPAGFCRHLVSKTLKIVSMWYDWYHFNTLCWYKLMMIPGSVREHFERCLYFHLSVWMSPVISFRYMKIDRKPKNIMLKAFDYSVMSYFSRDDLLRVCHHRELSNAENWNLWRFEAAIRTIIIIMIS